MLTAATSQSRSRSRVTIGRVLSLCAPPTHVEHLRQLPLGQAGLLEHLTDGLAEPGERASHLILVSLEEGKGTLSLSVQRGYGRSGARCAA